MRATILSSDRLGNDAKDFLADFILVEESAPDEVLREVTAFMAWPSRVTPDFVGKMPGLLMLQSFSAGVDALDFGGIPAGVRVFSNAGAYTDSVAEHAWGLALGVASGTHNGRKRLPPKRLRGRTIVVLGAGAIGSEVARIARNSLMMNTIGVSRSFPHPEVFDRTLPPSALTEGISEGDLIVNALPLTKATAGVISYEVLSRAKPNSILVNVGRGGTMDEAGVLRWLKERPECRYATDVFWKRDGKEVFDSEIWDLPNFGGTIHTAAAQDPEALSVAHRMAAENVRRFLLGESPANEVDLSEY